MADVWHHWATKGILFFCFCMFSPISFAGPKFTDILKKSNCKAQIERSLAKVGVQQKWTGMLSEKGFDHSFKAPTEKIGQWVIFKVKGQSAHLYVENDKEITHLKFSPPQCKPTRKAHPLKVVKSKNDFTDQDLRDLVMTNSKVVFYIWSPGFVYSGMQLPMVRDIAKKFGFMFVPLLESSVSHAAIKKYATRTGQSFKKLSRRVASIELMNRDVFVHQPAVIFAKDGKIIPKTFTGARPDIHWKRIFFEMVIK